MHLSLRKGLYSTFLSWFYHYLFLSFFSFWQKTQHASDRKTIRCCCRSSGPIALKAEMQRSAYCPGEFVNIRTKLDNNSDKTMKLGVKFIQVGWLWNVVTLNRKEIFLIQNQSFTMTPCLLNVIIIRYIFEDTGCANTPCLRFITRYLPSSF